MNINHESPEFIQVVDSDGEILMILESDGLEYHVSYTAVDLEKLLTEESLTVKV